MLPLQVVHYWADKDCSNDQLFMINYICLSAFSYHMHARPLPLSSSGDVGASFYQGDAVQQEFREEREGERWVKAREIGLGVNPVEWKLQAWFFLIWKKPTVWALPGEMVMSAGCQLLPVTRNQFLSWETTLQREQAFFIGSVQYQTELWCRNSLFRCKHKTFQEPFSHKLPEASKKNKSLIHSALVIHDVN